MDRGGRFGWLKLLRFNGHFFADAEVLPLEVGDLSVLAEAAAADWRKVEPTIFGTLLTRALDPRERHRLGAEYTPRDYVERVVRQTIEVPLRERWAPIKARVLQLRDSKGRAKRRDREEALKLLHEFHDQLRSLHFLDPACGSGNFLYVTLLLVKLVELEVLREIEAIRGNRELGLIEVHPKQFHGIEVQPWAREIAELTLWIGFHQFWKDHHEGGNVPEPVLEDTGTLECRDAVLAWLGDPVEIPEKSRPDPTPRKLDPATGRLVPDPSAMLAYFEYDSPTEARWPFADYIIGNPPYLGQARQREAFGAGYVDALRAAYPEVPDTADYVTYWWYRAAREVAVGRATRAGLITTSSIVQGQNRAVMEAAAAQGARVTWAVADHPWVDERDGADVRVALTVIARDPTSATLAEVDDEGRMVSEKTVARLNADLSWHADVARAANVGMLSNRGVCSDGVKLHGKGFLLSREEAMSLLRMEPKHKEVVHPYLNGRDLAQKSRRQYVLDFGLADEVEARRYPVLFDLVRARVKPDRDANKRDAYRKYWWRFGEPRREWRDAVRGQRRFIATVDTARHRYFVFVDASVVTDDKLVNVASTNPYHLGVLSSAIHCTWATAAGGRLGVGNDPVYVKTFCFDPFPFPTPSRQTRERIGFVAEELDRHRKDALARDERVTMTGMYNVLQKLRSGEALTAKERDIHTIAAVGVLKDLHDELDALVAEAYGWPWPMEREEILERLVALHDERVEEEKRGIVRWLRPEYQIPRFGKDVAATQAEAELDAEAPQPAAAEGIAATLERRPWPQGAVEQIAALKSLVDASPVTVTQATAAFQGARADLVRRHLETLALVGEVRADQHERYAAVSEPL